MSISLSITNWLTKIAASKEEFLFNKYHKMARKKWYLPPEPSVRINPRFYIGGPEEADKTLKEIIKRAVAWNPKYAEWLVYRMLQKHTFNNSNPFYGIHLNLNYLNDYLRHGQIPSFQTTKAEAEKLAKDWHDMMAAKAAEYKDPLDVAAKLSDGFMLVKVSAKDAKAEGYHMGHCVGDYCENINSGKSIIYSIRDPDNEPHVTIELSPVGTGKEKHYAIEQMKGRQNKPQPKYVKYVEEALDFFMQSPSEVTFGREGFNDYAGFQEDEAIIKQRVAQIHGQQNISQYHPIIDAYYHARSGVDDSDLESWLSTESGYAWLEDMKKTEPDLDRYLDFLIKNHPDVRQDLVEDLERIHSDEILGEMDPQEDENGDEDDEEEKITFEQWKDIEKSILEGDVDTFEMTDSMRETVSSFASSLWYEGYDAAEYIIHTQRSSAEEAYIESLDSRYDDLLQNNYGDRYGLLPSEYYKKWAQERRREKEDERWRKNNEAVERIIKQYNIQINPEIRKHDLAELYRGHMIRYYDFQKSATPQQAAAQWISEWVANKNREWEEYNTKEASIDSKIEQWKPIIETSVPGYSTLNYWDQRKLIVQFLDRPQIDQEVIQVAQQLVNMSRPAVASLQRSWLKKPQLELYR